MPPWSSWDKREATNHVDCQEWVLFLDKVFDKQYPHSVTQSTQNLLFLEIFPLNSKALNCIHIFWTYLDWMLADLSACCSSQRVSDDHRLAKKSGTCGPSMRLAAFEFKTPPWIYYANHHNPVASTWQSNNLPPDRAWSIGRSFMLPRKPLRQKLSRKLFFTWS